MSPRSLFIIILRVIGIFILKDVLSNFFQLLDIVFTQFGDALFMVGLFTAGSLAITAGLFWITVFRPDIIVDKLKLDQGFKEEKFSLVIEAKDILKYALIAVGIFIFIENIPLLCSNLITYYEKSRLGYGNTNGITIVFIIAKLIIAYVLLTNFNQIIDLIEKRKKQETDTTTIPSSETSPTIDKVSE